MSRKKVIQISSLSVVALVIVTAIVIIIISIIKRTSNDGSRDKNRSDDKQSSSIKTIERDPLDVIGVDTLTISGTLTISECLEKSHKSPLVFYLLDGSPKKDANVDAVIVFYQGKVVMFDKIAISARYEEKSIGELIKLDQKELIRNLKDEHAKQVKTAIATLIGDDERFIIAAGLCQKNALGEGITEEDIRSQYPFFLCKDLPVDSDYNLVLYTDDSGNNTEKEVLMIPDVWPCNNVLFPAEEIGWMEGCNSSEFVAGGYTVGDVSHMNIMGRFSKYDPDTNLTELTSEYMEMREELEEEGIPVNTVDVIEIDVTQAQSGTIYDSEYIGFNVPGKGTMIAICEPESAVTADDPAKGRDNTSIFVDPKQEQQNEIKYVMALGIYNSAEYFLDKTSVAEYLDPKLNKQLADKLIQEGKYYEWAYMLLEYLGFHEDVLANKYERAKAYLNLQEYAVAYRLLEESGHTDEIKENQYERAEIMLNNLGLMYADNDYEPAYELLRVSGHEDDINQHKYERAKKLLEWSNSEEENGMDFDALSEYFALAYRLLEESGHSDEVKVNKHERALNYINEGVYYWGYELLKEIGCGDECADILYKKALQCIQDGRKEEVYDVLFLLKQVNNYREYKDSDTLIISTLPEETVCVDNAPVYKMPGVSTPITYLNRGTSVYLRGYCYDDEIGFVGNGVWYRFYWWENNQYHEGWTRESYVTSNHTWLQRDMLVGYFELTIAFTETWGDYTVGIPADWTFCKGDAFDENDTRYCSVKNSIFGYFDFKMETEDVAKQHYEYNKNTYTNEQEDVYGTYGDIEWAGFQYSDGRGRYGFELIATVKEKTVRVSSYGFKFDSEEVKMVLDSLVISTE